MRAAPALVVAALALCGAARAETFDLPATSRTVVWGAYDPKVPPALRVRSGDTVVVHTLLTNSPAGLEKAGVASKDVEASLREVFANVPASERGPAATCSPARSTLRAPSRRRCWRCASAR